MGDGGSLLASPEDARCGEAVSPPTQCEEGDVLEEAGISAGPLLTHSCMILGPAPPSSRLLLALFIKRAWSSYLGRLWCGLADTAL